MPKINQNIFLPLQSMLYPSTFSTSPSATFALIPSFCHFFPGIASVECWKQIAFLRQSPPLGGICISCAPHYKFIRYCAPSSLSEKRRERGWRCLWRDSHAPKQCFCQCFFYFLTHILDLELTKNCFTSFFVLTKRYEHFWADGLRHLFRCVTDYF